jgi:hypothetical protein
VVDGVAHDLRRRVEAQRLRIGQGGAEGGRLVLVAGVLVRAESRDRSTALLAPLTLPGTANDHRRRLGRAKNDQPSN